MATAPAVHRFTIDEYHAMAEAGVLPPGVRVELIEGEVIEMSAMGRRHLAAVDRLAETFILTYERSAIVRVQGSIRLPPYSEPEPDLIVLARREDFYATSDAGAEHAMLAIEVADSSLSYDMKRKAPLYAREGIPEYWIVDLTRDLLLVYVFGEGRELVEPIEMQTGTLSPRLGPSVSFDVATMLSTARGPS